MSRTFTEAAIAGIGATEFSKESGRSELQLAAECAKSACEDAGIDVASLGKLGALSGVREFPARVKCATLVWHALRAALQGRGEPVSTE